MRFLVTGGAGFIGSALVRYLIHNTSHEVLNIDCLTYASNLNALSSVAHHERYFFEKIDITDADAVNASIQRFKPNIIMHLAAESHVDRSIDSAFPFIQTNIIGTYILLEAARHYFKILSQEEKSIFKFHHISTDEVYGDLELNDTAFTEKTPYSPSSPYSASKASSDHLVRAWHRTYSLPVVITNCSNNYGPYQHSEKLIPLMISNALTGKALPVYGSGQQIRDWLFVDDHVRALYKVVTNGRVGQTYNIGGNCEKQNIEVVYTICDLLQEIRPPSKDLSFSRYRDLISFVQDRPGHDKRYAINATKIFNELDWQPQENFESGLRKTVEWYLSNQN